MIGGLEGLVDSSLTFFSGVDPLGDFPNLSLSVSLLALKSWRFDLCDGVVSLSVVGFLSSNLISNLSSSGFFLSRLSNDLISSIFLVKSLLLISILSFFWLLSVSLICCRELRLEEDPLFRRLLREGTSILLFALEKFFDLSIYSICLCMFAIP